jgi:hypothetical protein
MFLTTHSLGTPAKLVLVLVEASGIFTLSGHLARYQLAKSRRSALSGFLVWCWDVLSMKKFSKFASLYNIYHAEYIPEVDMA